MKVDSGTGATTSYAYDVFGNLRHVVLPNGDAVDYLIDGQNRRVGKKINNALIQGFLYLNNSKPVAELDGTGSVVSIFVYADRTNVPSYMLKNGHIYRIVADHRGSPRLILDANAGTVAQRIDYDEWGNVLLDTNPGFQPFGFAGGLYDGSTRLLRFGKRDYDPDVGRWVAKDPGGFDESPVRYEYAHSDPVDYIDRTGGAGERSGGSLMPPYRYQQRYGSPYPLRNGPQGEAEPVEPSVDESVKNIGEKIHQAEEACKRAGPACMPATRMRQVQVPPPQEASTFRLRGTVVPRSRGRGASRLRRFMDDGARRT